MAMQLPSSSSSFSYRFTYQVFLSFRGSDTRNGFIGHLYKALTEKGINTFIDDNDLQRGDEITPSLVKAIEESRIFIPVFSINYATSSFCLDELVHIIHCYNTKGRLVLPIFFGVDPSHVRHHRGSYGKALAKHEERFQNNTDNMERLRKWKIALTQAANLSGDHFSNGYEYKFIGEIVKYISNKISRQPLHVANYPVGLQSRVQQVKSLLDVGSDDKISMVGLYGSGGMGKSTLAKAIYNFIADQFECSCFLENVRENSTSNNLKHLQEELLLKTLQLEIKLGGVSEGIPYIKERLHRKKVLLILDDVDNMKQLFALAGGLDWFGRGSRVIITTRDKHLLTCHGIESMHEVEGLYGAEALELLRWMAFKNDKVASSYEDVLNRAAAYASGLPLALEVMGSNLFGQCIKECKSTLDKYERIPHEDIQKILKISFDALDEEQQSVFLDITCCLKGFKSTEVEEILHGHYGHCIKSHIGMLVDKSLIKISWCSSSANFKMTLHDLIEVMGKEIVRKESTKEPEKRSRLWCRDDILHILQEGTGTSKIEMIYLNSPSIAPVIDWNGKAFKKMTNLKTLIIENGLFSKGSKYLPSSLRVLKWKGCCSMSLSSSILSKKFQNMKVLTLDQCEYLTHIPNVSGLENLENFSFEYCHNLITIDSSIGHLNKLENLCANFCTMLEHFPPLRLKSLKELELSQCFSLNNFPELLCEMPNINYFRLADTSIEELPSSFQNLNELYEVMLHGVFPKHNGKVYSNVRKLRLFDCNLLDECLPILLKWCVNVEHLNLWDNNFKVLPQCLNECHLLKFLGLDECKYLEEIRGFPPNLEALSAYECKSLCSSSRRMLLSQKVNEAGCTEIILPNGIERIPDWFEHQSRGDTISFWVRKKIPSITSIIILPEFVKLVDFDLFLNDNDITPVEFLLYEDSRPPGHAFLSNLKLDEHINNSFENEPKLYEEFIKNEWNHVELNWECISWGGPGEKFKRLRNCAQMGIHVWKEKSNTEEDVRFTDPYRKRKLNEYINYRNTLLSQVDPRLKKKRMVEVGVSETEILQQQHLAALESDMRNLVLTETKEKEHHLDILSGIWNLVLTERK